MAPVIVNGLITAINVVSGGSGYATNATVTIVQLGGGSGATATATIVGGVITAINMVKQGANYTPSVTIASNTGSGATAYASCSTLGVITSISVLTSGSNYTTAPSVTLTGAHVGIAAVLGAAQLGNVFGMMRHSAVWNVNSATVSSTNASGVMELMQCENVPSGVTWNVGSSFQQATDARWCSTVKPSITFFVNTNGYVNPVSISTVYHVANTSPN